MRATATTRITKPSISTTPLAPFPSPTPPWTLAERLHRIEALSKRIESYIQYISQIGGMKGASEEVKERAVKAFYEQLVVVERQLGRIHDELKLE